MFLAIVADGAGSAPLGGEGASLACRSVELSARAHLANGSGIPDDASIGDWIDLARDRLAIAANNRGVPRRQLASTLLIAIATADELVVAHIGDGGIVYRGDDPDSWEVASWPAHGEFANTTYFLTDDPAPSTRFARFAGPIRGVAVFSDGIERLVLNMAQRRAHAPFFCQMLSAFDGVDAVGRIPALSAGLSKYLDSSAINERTDDDKTLVLAVCR